MDKLTSDNMAYLNTSAHDVTTLLPDVIVHNDTEVYPTDDWTSFLLPSIATVMYLSIIMLSLSGNCLVIYTITNICGTKSTVNCFIVNLACADILMAVVCIPFTFIADVLIGYWPFGSHFCRLVTYSQAVAVFCNAFTLVCISVDRRRVVCKPLERQPHPKTALVTLGCVWAASLVLPLPVTVAGLLSDGRGGWADSCVEVLPWGDDPGYRFVYTVMVMICQYFLPLGILMFAYVNIAYVIWIKRPPGEPEHRRDQRLADARKKMIKMMMTVVIIYAVCWLPLHTIILVGDLYENFWNFPHAKVVWIMCHWLAMSNCCYNPIVYWWMGSNFRSGFRVALSRCCCGHCSRCFPVLPRQGYQPGYSVAAYGMDGIERVRLSEWGSASSTPSVPRRINCTGSRPFLTGKSVIM